MTPLPPAAETDQRGAATRAATPRLAEFNRTQLANWRISSFSALTRGVHQPVTLGELESHGDEILDFPAGSHIGLMLHSLLERLDFQAELAPQCERLFAQLLPAAGNFSPRERQTLQTWLDNILRTPLDSDALRLDQLAGSRRLNELEFDLALNRLDVDALNLELQARSPQPLIPISTPEFQGLINGIIDLVFEHDGRYYLADYKSNFLGSSIEDYRPERLQQAMWQRRYDLQSLIYTVALHRLLQQRLADYDYERHFGGSYYLFLRAMRPHHGNAYGIHFERPGRDAIEAIENLFAYSGTAT